MTFDLYHICYIWHLKNAEECILNETSLGFSGVKKNHTDKGEVSKTAHIKHDTAGFKRVNINMQNRSVTP